MKNVIRPIKGTRDFYPENMAVRNWLYQTARQVSEAFGYQEYEGPILESLELYAAKSGEELVKEQAYVFPDRGGDQITLRPELTPTLARMIAQRQQQLVYPLRWWSFGPFWRYEKPQKGRTREFFQWNIDMIGVDTPEADAELIAILVTFFQKVGLTPQQVNVLVNDRRLMDVQLTELGIPAERRAAVSNWIDRRDKLSADEWTAYGRDIGLDAAQLQGVQAMLEDLALWQRSPELRRLFDALRTYGVSEYVRFDPNVVRGLLYYTGTVWEAFDVRGGVRRAIMGGGRYNNLMADVGGDPLPAVGFAMGDVVISLILDELGLLPKGGNVSPAAVLVTVFDAERMPASLELATELRRAGFNVACHPEVVKLPRQFKYADRMGIRLAAVIGPDEAATGQVTIKDLQRGLQQTIARSDAPALIGKWLADNPSS